jgi:hypothetical protein
LIDGGQLLSGLIALLSRSSGHYATSLQADQCREIASRHEVTFIGREAYSRSIQSEVGCGYQRGATFMVPHFFPLDEGAAEPHLDKEHAESALSSRKGADAVRDRWAVGRLSGDARSVVYCPTFTEGTSGGKKYQKKLIA